MRDWRAIGVILALALTTASGASSAGTSRLAPSGWRVAALAVPNGWSSCRPTAINDSGLIVGTCRRRTTAGTHAFAWGRGSPTDLGTLAGLPYVEPVAINARGEIAGRCVRYDGDERPTATIGFVWHAGRMTSIGLGAYGQVAGLNDDGRVIGRMTVKGDDQSHGFVWAEGHTTDLGSGVWPAAINNRGQVVGTAVSRGFLWEGGRITDLGTLGGELAAAVGISERGEVIGSSEVRRGGSHAFLWKRGQMTDLGTLGGSTSDARGINERGQIIGNALTKQGKGHPFLWQSGHMIDLSSPRGGFTQLYAINDRGDVIAGDDFGALVRRSGRWTALGRYAVYAINNRSQIVGTGGRASDPHAVLLQPPRG